MRRGSPLRSRSFATAKQGFTLIEVMIASVITSLVAAGTFMAFVAAARMNREQNNPQNAEAAGYAQQTIERFRSRIACSPADIPASPWFDANCNATLPVGWQDDPLPPGNPGAGSESLLNSPNNVAPNPLRRYCVTAADCDGDAAVGDCYSIQVRVCWDGIVCPAVGAACP